MRGKAEKILVKQLAQYMQLKHRNIKYRFDLIADFPMSINQANWCKMIHPRRGHPDFILLKPSGIYAGLFLELKAEGKSPFKRNGDLKKDKHLEEQMNYMRELIMDGYKANFAIGFDDAVKQIEEYLNE